MDVMLNGNEDRYKTIAIILARGGSKRIPKKNIYKLGELPMVAWTIRACIESKCFDKILVSTDSTVIAKTAIYYGAEVPFLRDTAFDDHATSSEATLAALLQSESFWKTKFSIVAQLMACCPFRNANDINEAFRQFSDSQSNSLISCSPFGYNNPWWAFNLDENSKPNYLFKEKKEFRSQDLPKLFCPNGSIWISSRKSLVENKTFYTSDHDFFAMSWQSGFDIDNSEDLEIADLIQKGLAQTT